MKPSWNLVADIGGTNARFAVLMAGKTENLSEFQYTVQQQPVFLSLIETLMERIISTTGWHHPPANACFAVACPANLDPVSITNCPWHFTRHELQSALKCESVTIINDFAAMAHGIHAITETDVFKSGVAMGNRANQSLYWERERAWGWQPLFQIRATTR